MILTDIYVPAQGRTYDFQLDEDVPVRILTGEITGILRKQTGGTVMRQTGGAGKADADDCMLCSRDRGMVLSKDLTLRECGIRNGSRLLLV